MHERHAHSKMQSLSESSVSLAEIAIENGTERPKLQLFLHKPNHLLLGEKDSSESRCKFFGLILVYSFTMKVSGVISVKLLKVMF